MAKLYVASSWRNTIYPEVLQALRDAGHDCYDFRNPEPGNNGFAWSQIDPNWQNWSPEHYRRILQQDPVALDGYRLDSEAMEWADACVLVMPSGRSAHIEAGWMRGQGKPLVILLNEDGFEPDLMYNLTPYVALDIGEALEMMDEAVPMTPEEAHERMRKDLEYFVGRVEDGSIRSTVAYNRFKRTLTAVSKAE